RRLPRRNHFRRGTTHPLGPKHLTHNQSNRIYWDCLKWAEVRRYVGLEFLAEARLRVISGDPPYENTTQQAITA
ncbi:hypothetical protein, partial [Actinoallomurus sp. NPDC050550]|uniref:hypothetical protein n=1 Tax=Actinoallomurus sp. NPDC050550 TaxID=3154937 RepID=UPI0033E79155